MSYVMASAQEPDTSLLDDASYAAQYTAKYGNVAYLCDWNTAVRQNLVVKVSETSTVQVFGGIATNLWGIKKLAEFKSVSGTQEMFFSRPQKQNSLYVLISHGNATYGYVVDVTNPEVNDAHTSNSIELNEYVTTVNTDIEVDQYALDMLRNGQNNSGKVTQSSRYVSDGNPVVVTPVFSDCGYVNTFGIYLQQGDEVGEKLDLWTKTTNHTSGVMNRPVFTINLPVGVVYGFYIRNTGGTYYSDASLNASNARAAGVLKGDNCFYLAFEDMPLRGDMDYNDMVFKIEMTTQVLDTDPVEWTIAAELDEFSSDFDFNDVVFKISYFEGDDHLEFTPLAAGIDEAVDVYFHKQYVGEIHSLLHANENSRVNVLGDGLLYDKVVTANPIRIEVSEGFSLADDMGGFSFSIADRVVSAPKKGDAPRMLLMCSGEWSWPTEGTSIEQGHQDFPWDKDFLMTNNGIIETDQNRSVRRGWYTLQGRKAKNVQRGVFLNEGKKYFIK